MSDQKRWFKVWSTILIDPHFSNMSLEDIGRWTLLGAAMVAVGCKGKITGDKSYFETLLRCPRSELEAVIKRFPKCTFEECKSVYGEFTVTVINWHKYQIDTTAKQRMKTLRSKRRGEEKRKEEIPQTPKNLSVTPVDNFKTNQDRLNATPYNPRVQALIDKTRTMEGLVTK